MNNISLKRGAGAEFVDIKARLATTHDPLFPFASPIINDRLSLQSGCSGNTLHAHSSFDHDPSTFVTRSSENERHPEQRIEDANQQSRSEDRIWRGKKDMHKRSRPGLQVITTFSQSPFRQGKISFNQVAARQPKQGKNRARSIVSQKGIRVLPSPITNGHPAQVISNLRDLIKNKREHEAAIPGAAKREQSLSSSTGSPVMFGLSVPKHDAPLYRHTDMLESAITHVTPTTPRIVITPADAEFGVRELGSPSSSASLYSKNMLHTEGLDNAKTAFPRPLPSRRFSTNDAKPERRLSSESQRQILAESCDTARPKSQGWWNLMLSPMLSRAGTLNGPRVAHGHNIPPVPPLPHDDEKILPLQTPVTAMSPGTPRRLGLANMRSSTSSRWTEWEDQRYLDDEHVSSLEDAVPIIPRDYLAHGSTAQLNLATTEEFRGEGLAAEYFHACAVEQLANTKYFDCVNHSCAERLPKLQSIYDVHDKSLVCAIPAVGDNDLLNSSKGLLIDSKHNSTGAISSNIVSANGRTSRTPIPLEASSTTQRGRTLSPSDSEIGLGEVVSPNIRHANVAMFSRAKTIESRGSSPAPSVIVPDIAVKQVNVEPVAPITHRQLSPQPSSSIPAAMSRQPSMEPIAALPRQKPPSALSSTTRQLSIDLISSVPHQKAVESPGPISPDATRTIAPAGGMPMAPLQSLPAESTVPLMAPIPQTSHALVPPFQPAPSIVYYPYGQTGPYPYVTPSLHQYPAAYQVPPHMFGPMGQSGMSQEPTPSLPSVRDHYSKEQAREGSEPQEEHSREVIEQTKKLKEFDLLRCFHRSKSQHGKKSCRTVLIAALLIIIILLCILFAILFTRGHGNVTPIESQWLNLTGYPPVPTGISTIARPNLAASQNQCTQPTTLWSCALPKEDQANISPNEPDQPNFRFQIRFRNGTVPANMTVPLNKRADDPSADDLFVPNPTPPGLPDQVFLGNTTDNTTKPFEGESTPFFITFMSSSPGQAVTARKVRKLMIRQSGGDGLLNSIPAPSIGADGTAAAANLLPTTPFPVSQPIKLYNRGLRDEHYGFYIYYDKSIFLSGIVLQNGTAANNSLLPADADQNGGNTKQAANVRCTWSQTRFIVKMYTNPAFGATILSGAPANSTGSNQGNSSSDSATDFSRPGSFPYPTTILLDRHGGDINKKLIYCYGMDSGNIVNNAKILASEIRSFGGVAINPSPQLINQGDSTFDSSLGGIDGGTGGCGCTWQNWT